MKNRLILSIFPGLDLFGRAWEEEGFTVLRGPDRIWGGDIRKFHIPKGMFEGVIGGPPCQIHSSLAALGNTSAQDLTYEFLRIVREAEPKYAVMENVGNLLKANIMPSDWAYIKLRDYDCGGLTNRTRIFWIWPSTLILAPPRRKGKAELSVLAYSWKSHNSKNRKMHMQQNLSIEEAARLQGFPELVDILRPLGRKNAVMLLGNGVPKAMGRYIARAIKEMIE